MVLVGGILFVLGWGQGCGWWFGVWGAQTGRDRGAEGGEAAVEAVDCAVVFCEVLGFGLRSNAADSMLFGVDSIGDENCCVLL